MANFTDEDKLKDEKELLGTQTVVGLFQTSQYILVKDGMAIYVAPTTNYIVPGNQPPYHGRSVLDMVPQILYTDNPR